MSLWNEDADAELQISIDRNGGPTGLIYGLIVAVFYYVGSYTFQRVSFARIPSLTQLGRLSSGYRWQK